MELTLSYVPPVRDFARVGGLKVTLVKNQGKEQDSAVNVEEEECSLQTQGEVHSAEAQVLSA